MAANIAVQQVKQATGTYYHTVRCLAIERDATSMALAAQMTSELPEVLRRPQYINHVEEFPDMVEQWTQGVQKGDAIWVLIGSDCKSMPGYFFI